MPDKTTGRTRTHRSPRGTGAQDGEVLPMRRAPARPYRAATDSPRRHSMATEVRPPDTDLKARHRAMWASGDYPSMVETFLLPLGPRLVEACRIAPGMRVLDVGAGPGNASIPAAQRGADVTAGGLTPAPLQNGPPRPEGARLAPEW